MISLIVVYLVFRFRVFIRNEFVFIKLLNINICIEPIQYQTNIFRYRCSECNID